MEKKLTFNEQMKELLKEEALYVRTAEKAYEKLKEAQANLKDVRQRIADVANSAISTERTE